MIATKVKSIFSFQEEVDLSRVELLSTLGIHLPTQYRRAPISPERARTFIIPNGGML